MDVGHHRHVAVDERQARDIGELRQRLVLERHALDPGLDRRAVALDRFIVAHGRLLGARLTIGAPPPDKRKTLRRICREGSDARDMLA